MSERQHPAMTDELAKQWMEWIKDGSKFYLTQVGKGLEDENMVAWDFLGRAQRLDPEFVERYFVGYSAGPGRNSEG